MSDKTSKDFMENFTSWDDCYRDNKVENMPWYQKNLDHDLENELISKNIKNGKFLDLGTGPGTQALHLVERNFEVTATDISPNAIKKAKKLSNKINFLVDDILNSKLSDREFDFIFDRGIFHGFDILQRPQYIREIKRILDENGILFLKCMSIDEKKIQDGILHRFSKQEVIDAFEDDFEIQRIDDSLFHSGGMEFAALFAILKKKSF